MLPRVDIIRDADATWLLMNSKDHISETIRTDGNWGVNEAKICTLFLQEFKNPVVIDVGANLGGFTVPIAKELSRRQGLIFSFEPQRIVFQQLCANIFINSLDNVYPYNAALGDEISSIEIPELDFRLSRNVGGFTIDEKIRSEIDKEAKLGKTFSNTKNSNLTYTVPKLTLDSFGIFNNVAFVKIDVEGYELEVLQGSTQTLVKNSFPPVIFEVWEDKVWYEQKAAKTKKCLEDLGYSFEHFGREILAQHPKHSQHIVVSRTSGGISMTLRKTKI
jgi:FkbM family methyltransferase